MTRKEQYAQDLSNAASMIEDDADIQAMFGTGSAEKRLRSLAARLRNYGCLNPFREPDKKVRKEK